MIAIVAMAACLIASVAGWGFQGHRMTTQVASHFILPSTEAAIEKYLGSPLWKKSSQYPQVRDLAAIVL